MQQQMQPQRSLDLEPLPGPAEDATLDWDLLRDILRRRAVLWAVLGPLLALTLLLVLLWRVPPQFTSTASLSMQQQTGGAVGGALSALSGLGGSQAKSYLGIVRSRRFAVAAAQQAKIQQLYGLATPDDAIDLVQKSVSLDDRNDGLLYLTVTLPGPTRLSPNAGSRQKQVQVATKQITDDYLRSLKNYLETSNSDQGAALLRQASGQLNEARLAYNASVRRLTSLAAGDVPVSVSASAAADIPTVSISEEDTGDTGDIGTMGGTKAASRASNSSSPGGGLEQLYLSRGQLAAEIQAALAAQQGASRLAGGQVASLTDLPAEDPLLSEARAQVRQAAADLQNLRINLADDNPDVVAARVRLAEAQRRLRSQSQALQRGQTSDTVQISALQAKYAAVTRQISAAERDFKTGRRFGAAVEERRNDVMLHLEVYKTAATQYAMLAMQTVAGGNLMDVIDEGRIPDSGKPGVGILVAISLGAALFLLNLWLSFEYLWRIRRKPRPLPALTGTGQNEVIPG